MALAPRTEADFESDSMRSLGFQYQVLPDRLLGFDPERPELGKITVLVAREPGGVTKAKLELMATLCANLSDEQKTRRIYLKVAL